MTSSPLRLLLAACAAVLLLAACKKHAAPASAPAMPPQEVAVVTLEPRRVEITTELPGRTAACRIAEVRPQVSGIILKRLFNEGADVTEGQQLYQIDPATYQAAYDSAQAAVARAEATVEVSRLLAERRKKLVSTSVISRQDYDDASASLKQAEADLASSRAALEKARIDLVYTRVLSPISGRIGRSTVTEGALVTSGQAAPLAVVQQLDPIYVDVTQSSSQLLRFRRQIAAGQLTIDSAGQTSVRLTLEDGSAYSDPGTLQFSEVTVDQGTGSVTLRAVFPNPRHILLPGMFVRALIKEGVNEHALLVPQRGVTRNARGEPTALVVGGGDRVELRILATDRVIGDQWLVTSGLLPGDRVIVEGVQKTAPGAVVRTVPYTPPAASPSPSVAAAAAPAVK